MQACLRYVKEQLKNLNNTSELKENCASLKINWEYFYRFMNYSFY